MNKMIKQFNYDDVVSWKPCYDPVEYLGKTWTGTAIDILEMNHIPFNDRLWVVMRPELLSEKLMRLFAVWSYRETLRFISNPDPRSIYAANVAEAFALGKATEEELKAAREAALAAALAAAWTVSASASAAADAAGTAGETTRAAVIAAKEAAGWLVAEMTENGLPEQAGIIKIAIEENQKNKLIDMILEENNKE